MESEVNKEPTDHQKMVEQCDKMAQAFLDIINLEMVRPFMSIGALNTAITSIALHCGMTPDEYQAEQERLSLIYKGLYEQHREKSAPVDRGEPELHSVAPEGHEGRPSVDTGEPS